MFITIKTKRIMNTYKIKADSRYINWVITHRRVFFLFFFFNYFAHFKFFFDTSNCLTDVRVLLNYYRKQSIEKFWV